MTALYLALSRGTMGLIAPLSGVIAAAVPVLVSVARGQPHPSRGDAGHAAGAGRRGRGGDAGRRAMPRPPGDTLRRASASSSGGWRPSRGSGSRPTSWASTGRIATGPARGGPCSWHAARGSSWSWRSSWRSPRPVACRRSAGPAGAAPVLTLSAVGDLGGNLFYVLALGQTTLAVAVVLSSLYPVMTALLARTFLG